MLTLVIQLDAPQVAENILCVCVCVCECACVHDNEFMENSIIFEPSS